MAGRGSYKKSGGSSAKKKDMYAEATRNIISIMEQGEMPWSKGRLSSGAPSPSNFNTGKRYRGVNVINLMCLSHIMDLSSNFFITYNQALKVSGVNRKDPQLLDKSPLTGQKAVGHVTYWGNVTKDKNDKMWFVMENGKKRTSPTPTEVKAQQLKQFWFLRDTAVFAFEHMDKEKIPQAWLEKRDMHEKLHNQDIIENTQDKGLAEKVRSLAKGLGVKIEHDQYVDCPHYKPLADKIVMPPMELYENDNRYHHSLLHELTHATGHPSRMDRESMKDYDNSPQSKAYEELVAELGGVFMAIELGIKTSDSSDLQNHASYIKSWHRLLSDDLATGNCTLLHKACSEAEKAVDFLLNPPALKLEKTKEVEESSLTM